MEIKHIEVRGCGPYNLEELREIKKEEKPKMRQRVITPEMRKLSLNYLQKRINDLYLETDGIWQRMIHDPSYDSVTAVCAVAGSLCGLIAVIEDMQEC